MLSTFVTAAASNFEFLDDYRSPASIESRSSNESHSHDSGGQSSDEAEQHPSNYDAQSDTALAATFSSM